LASLLLTIIHFTEGLADTEAQTLLLFSTFPNQILFKVWQFSQGGKRNPNFQNYFAFCIDDVPM
jgi:hypothetical protein